ncbi:MAG: PAS domain-containing protein [Deltaproteobacteria bacterium]|nr:PAS domain-containing protein [Deltaproteobacteria bacterium]
MDIKHKNKLSWLGTPPWIILGAVIIFIPIFSFWTFENINKQKEQMIFLLLEKGAALIRSFEAGARTGMMGMMGMRRGNFRLQRLLTETARQPDILYLMVPDMNGVILAHSDPDKIGDAYVEDLDLRDLSKEKNLRWREVKNKDGRHTFEIYRSYQIIFVGLDMEPMESARKEDMRHTLIMAAILLLIGFAGIFFLFLLQAYRSTRTSLSRIKAFSDTVVENMPTGLVAVDPEGNIVSFNHTAGTILQLDSNDTLAKRAEENLPYDFMNLLNEAADQDRIIEKEMDCTLDDGRTLPMDVSVSKLAGDDGQPLGHVILFRDMTEIQSLKNEIERSQRLASIGKLAAGVAHEIRNPLSSIKGFATYFKERYRDIPEDHKTAGIMVQEVERLNRVITQLLEFARPVEIQKKSSDIHQLIRHSMKMIEGEARSKHVELKVSLDPEIQYVPMDQDRMNQVLLNMYLNALEAMEHGGTLTVQVVPGASSQKVQITVSDTGSGIRDEDLVHIFDPYFTTKQSGTGLGLAIVHKIIESHDGEVKVKSVVGKGTTMSICLPY